MTITPTTLRMAIAAVAALGATLALDAAAAKPGMEQCAGVIKAGKNDCATSMNACHSHVKVDSHPEAWIYVPNGTCAKIAGARVVVANDPTPPGK
ncbi:MAG: DUF2282 domain-containing protein [Gammaproteobacteria bacterium]|nr:DUF2282 domain-containing protein [Gammaproteobacteria bacterium]